MLRDIEGKIKVHPPRKGDRFSAISLFLAAAMSFRSGLANWMTTPGYHAGRNAQHWINHETKRPDIGGLLTFPEEGLAAKEIVDELRILVGNQNVGDSLPLVLFDLTVSDSYSTKA